MSKPVIVIVDDEPMVTDTLKNLIELLMDIKAVTYNNPQEALSYIKSDVADILVTDFLMPQMNGLQLLKSSRDAKGELPVIILTGYHNSEELEDLPERMSGVQVMFKPWSTQVLVDQIKQMIESRGVGKSVQPA
ncbi:MAG: response regulator [Verrucomicrobiae bacterium]|nr:response regulator [Verrucomicrobiae bacterium]